MNAVHKRLLGTCLLLLLTLPTLGQRIRYVDAAATGESTGNSWDSAHTLLQDALVLAQEGDEIWVAAGTYKPVIPLSTGGTSFGERLASFELKNGVALYGGFAGHETALNQRDVVINATILSCDYYDDDTATIHVDEPSRSENCYHVITGAELSATTIVDGFTLTGGNANTLPPDTEDTGGGIYLILNSEPVLRNLHFTANAARFGAGIGALLSAPHVSESVFSNNAAANDGAGMYNFASQTVLDNVLFVDNVAEGLGGGLHNNRGEVIVNRTTLVNNQADWGGGMFNRRENTKINNVALYGNEATRFGGGMFNDEASATLMNVVFSGNRVTLDTLGIGGGLGNFSASPILLHVTFSGNTASRDGGALHNIRSSPTIINSIFWGNTADREGNEIFNTAFQSDPVVYYSIVKDGLTEHTQDGGGNQFTDPLFADPAGPDGILGTLDDNLRLTIDSPGIDGGVNSVIPTDTHDVDADGDSAESFPIDLDGNIRAYEGGSGLGLVDMGAYEFGAPPDGVGVHVEEHGTVLPQPTYGLSTYPNPFTDHTTIHFAVDQTEHVTLDIYDMLGRRVTTLVDDRYTPGTYEIPFNATALSSGVYLYRLTLNKRTMTRKMVLTR